MGRVAVKFERVITVEAQSESDALKKASKQFFAEVATSHELPLKVSVVMPEPSYVS